MLIKAHPPLQFNEFLQPVVLLGLDKNVQEFQEQHTIAGWGLIFYDSGNNYTETHLLHKAVLQRVDDAICVASYPDAFDDNMICSGRVRFGNCEKIKIVKTIFS